MCLILNGMKSSLKNTKHINFRYFFVKDVINRGEMSMEYCPIEEMWSDILTKPLQGRSYRIIKFKLVNMTELYVDTSENASEKISKALGVSTKKK